MPVRDSLLAEVDAMRRWRRHLHANPETAFAEHDTAAFVAGLLESWNIAVHRGLAGTGVVGTLSVGMGKRAIGLRADMDALDLDELNTFAHRSTRLGKMHACGHDGHMAMLLGAAFHLAKTKQFDGTVHFIFQPAEENVAGGRRMIADGLFDLFPVDGVYGMHNMPGLAEGAFVVQPGPMMASADFFEIEITGKGAHGGWPHEGVDSITIAAEVVLAMNQIAARTIDPLEPAVISVTQFQAGHTTNVLPGTATIAGTARAFSLSCQDQIEARMRRVSEGIAMAHGASARVIYDRRYPPTINHPDETEQSAIAARRVVSEENVLDNHTPVMGAEDFGWMLLERPGSYVWIGNGGHREGDCNLHNPRYDFNDAILPLGASYWVELVEQLLPASRVPPVSS